MPITLKATRFPNVYKSDNGIFYVRCWVAGKLFKKRLAAASLRVAGLEASKLIEDRRSELSDVLPFDSAVKEWLEHEEKRPELRPRTVEAKRFQCSHILGAFGEKPVNLITMDDVDRWWKELSSVKKMAYGGQKERSRIGSALSARTRNLALSAMNSVFKYHMERGLIRFNPAEHVKKIPSDSRRPVMPSVDDFKRIIAEIRKVKNDSESADVLEWMAYSGMRIGEVRLLKWEDVTDDQILVNGVKGTGWRVIPIFPPLARIISRKREEWGNHVPSGRVFLLEDPRVVLKRACKRLGLPHMVNHDMRHLFITTAREKGIPDGTIAKWVGHKDGGALLARTYSHIRDDHSMLMAEKMDW